MATNDPSRPGLPDDARRSLQILLEGAHPKMRPVLRGLAAAVRADLADVDEIVIARVTDWSIDQTRYKHQCHWRRIGREWVRGCRDTPKPPRPRTVRQQPKRRSRKQRARSNRNSS